MLFRLSQFLGGDSWTRENAKVPEKLDYSWAMTSRLVLYLVLAAAPAQAADQPLLVILEETGQSREGFPVLRLHPDQERTVRTLSRGFPGRIVRLYRLEQEYLHRKGGPAPEPAYLLFSSQQGGFPRLGFFLGAEDKRHVSYVDLHRRQALVGRFGAMDQIFPHELGHIILHQLAGEPKPCCANQVHAIGVRTDAVTAFDEGFAEHFQVMALDDPDADPSTRALTTNLQFQQQAAERLQSYRREMAARWSPFTRLRITFPFWFSQTEQVLRYHAVKRNAFAYEPDLPLLSDPYSAYLLENILPGKPGGRPKTAARMLATEGVVSAFVYRWMHAASPVEDAYIKLFHAMALHKPHTLAQLVAAYKNTFPDAAASVDTLVREILQGQEIPAAPEIWLANPDFRTGSTVFDQFRSAPRTHTFDLNAASLVDLIGVGGMTRTLAEAVLKSAPFSGLDELRRVPGMTPELLAGFRRMASEMDKLRVDKAQMEASMPLRTILLSFLWRALGGILLAAVLAAIAYRLVRPERWWRVCLNGLGAATVGMAAGWLGSYMMLPLLLFALPAVLWQLGRRRDPRQALRVLVAWTAASAPAAILIRPWF